MDRYLDENSRVDQAEDLLSTVDTYGMSEEKAEKVLADPNANPEDKDLADEVLAAADTYGLDEDSAEQVICKESNDEV